MSGPSGSGDGQSYSSSELKDMIALRVGPEKVPRALRVVTDTTDFFRVDYDDVAVLGGRPYLVRNYEREGRFGIDEQPKFWVRRAVDLLDGRVKVLKMVFHERFRARCGDLEYDCVRSPKKEERILDMVRGRKYFMQGYTVVDAAGNSVRVLDYIPGRTFADKVLGMGVDHEDYFCRYFPRVLDEYIELAGAIRFLHEGGETHGDIRRDHILVHSGSGETYWIDFDYNCRHRENVFSYDLFGLGNVLIYLVGRGDVTVQQLEQSGSPALDSLARDDLNIIFHNRVVNLRKVYPYIDESLNYVLAHFSLGANVFYENVPQLLADLEEARERMVST